MDESDFSYGKPNLESRHWPEQSPATRAIIILISFKLCDEDPRDLLVWPWSFGDTTSMCSMTMGAPTTGPRQLAPKQLVPYAYIQTTRPLGLLKT